MKYLDGIKIAIASLIENPLRTFLTLLGIVIGVMAVIFVISVIQGLNGYFAATLGDLGSDVFILQQHGSVRSRAEWLKVRNNPDITMDDFNAIRGLKNEIGKVSIEYRSRRSIRHGSTTVENVRIYGVSNDYFEVASIKVADGRAFRPAEASNAIFVGPDVVQALFRDGNGIGKKVKLMGESFTIVGVAEKKGSFLTFAQDNYAVIPLGTFKKLRVSSMDSGNIHIKARDALRLEQAIDEVRGLMRARHHLRYKDDDDFGFTTSESINQIWREETGMIFNVAIFVVSISLVVGGIVIMNIMLLSVVERTREIGIRKAIGASQFDIEFQFLVESIVLCASGGAIGVALAWLATWAVRANTPLPASFPMWAPLLAIGVTSTVGVIFGLHPARTAGKLDPIEALRSNEA